MQQFFRKVNLDIYLILILASIIAFGCMILYSASSSNQNVLNNQIIRISLGVICMIVVAQIPMRYWRVLIPWMFLLNLSLLIFTLFFGAEGKGAERWIDLGVFRFQPSETIKILLPILIAKIFTEYEDASNIAKVSVSFTIIGLVGFLIIKQPDLGTAILVCASGIFVVFLSSIPWSYILSFIATIIVALPIAWEFILHEYQKKRVLMFINPQIDPLGSGYHIIQSKIAIGSGGIFGKGFLQGTQSQLDFLPERTTDFIFAVLAEEFGLLGVIFLFFLYFLLVFKSIKIINNSNSYFSKLVGSAILFTFIIYVIVNVGMVSGLFPIVGLPLPLISFGGTSMLSIMIGFGILMSIKNLETKKYY